MHVIPDAARTRTRRTATDARHCTGPPSAGGDLRVRNPERHAARDVADEFQNHDEWDGTRVGIGRWDDERKSADHSARWSSLHSSGKGTPSRVKIAKSQMGGHRGTVCQCAKRCLDSALAISTRVALSGFKCLSLGAWCGNRWANHGGYVASDKGWEIMMMTERTGQWENEAAR